MKVDMSLEAVTGRLESMGELWELSVALMDSTKVKSPDVVNKAGMPLRELADNKSSTLVQDAFPVGS